MKAQNEKNTVNSVGHQKPSAPKANAFKIRHALNGGNSKLIRQAILVIAVVAVCLSCASAPPAHKPQQSFVLVTAPADAPPITGGTIYKAHFADTNWTVYQVYIATNGQTVSLPYDTNPVDLYTADSTNSITGGSSDYCNIYTNTVLASPSNITN